MEKRSVEFWNVDEQEAMLMWYTLLRITETWLCNKHIVVTENAVLKDLQCEDKEYKQLRVNFLAPAIY
jgi:hypothetical protein